MTAVRYIADYGRRLIPTLIDEYAREVPDKTYCFMARSSLVEDGFEAISYSKFADAISRCSLWMESELGRGRNFDTVAYLGPSDLRTTILIVAAIKTGHKVFLASPRNSLQAHLKLLQSTQCHIFMTTISGPPIAETILAQRSMNHILVPDLEQWLHGEHVKSYPYERTFEEARQEPFVVVHTSGSTGFPKPVIVTHGTVAASDTFNVAAPNVGRSPVVFEAVRGKRCFVSMPPFHIAGIDFMLAKALYYGLVPVLAPSNTPMNAELVDLMHRFDLVECSVVAPSILQEIAKTPSYLKSLQTLDVIAYGGGPLPREAGEIICSVTKLHNLMGGSEMFALATEMVDQKDWDYLRFSPMTGSELRHHSKGLWELYFVRQPALHLYQGIFSTFPELQEYNTNDLYSKHPTTPNLWRYSGRADDIITLTNGEKLNPTAMEDCINGHPDIESVLVVGQARFQTALLVEARNPPVTDYDREKLKDSLWPLMEQANKDCVAHGRLSKDLIVFTSHTKPFLRAGKGTIQQRMTVDSYESEINAIYDALEYLTAPKGQYTRPLLPWLRRLFIRLTGRNCLDDESDILASGMDSLQVLTAVREINSTVLNTDGIFKTPKITATVIYSNPTVEKLAKAIQKSMQSCDGNDPNLHEDPMQMQTMLSKYSRDMPNKRRPSTNPCSHASMYVLLTGSTGSLGSYLLKSLLDNPRVCKVYCLNRSIAAEKRQRRGHAICDWEQERVGFLHGDLSKSHLGLDVVLYRELLSTVTHVLHNAWEVNFNISFESFEKPHIYGVRQFIDFSSQSTKGAFIFFISSISAVMDWNLHHPGVVPERIISDFSAPAPMGYGRSKYVSELLLYNASKNAFVPSAICRVGQVAGPVEESHNHGIWNKHEWLPSLIASSKHLGKIPDSLGPNDAIDWIPVDILSRIIIQLLSASETPALRSGRYYTASTPPMPNGHSCNSCKTSQPAIEGEEVNPDITSPQVYHAVNPRHTTWANLLPAIHTYFSTPLETVSLRDWVGALAGSVLKGKDLDTNPAAKLLDIFQALVDEERQVAAVFETSQTKERSEALAGLEAVRVEWMGKWMEQWGF